MFQWHPLAQLLTVSVVAILLTLAQRHELEKRWNTPEGREISLFSVVYLVPAVDPH